MDIDLDLYRHEVRVSTNPLVRLSAIDISTDHAHSDTRHRQRANTCQIEKRDSGRSEDWLS